MSRAANDGAAGSRGAGRMRIATISESRELGDCLQLDPAARIADADELADLLEEGPESERESALGAGVATALMLAGAAALLLAIAAVVVMRRAPEPGPTTPRRASADPKTPDGRSPDDPRPDNTGPDETPESTSETTGPDESPKPGPETPPETTPETTPPEETGPARERSSELVRRLTESGHFRLDQRLSDARLKPASLGTEVLWLDDRRFVTSDLSGLVLVHDAKTGETLRQFATRGEIIDIAYLGNLSTYHVKLPTGQMIKAQTANTRRLSRRDFTWEDRVWLSWSDTAAVLLRE